MPLRWKALWGLLVLVLCATPVWGRASLQEDTAPLAHMVIGTSEGARFKRVGWDEFSVLSMGQIVMNDDTVDPGEGTVRILCATLDQLEIITQRNPVDCPAGPGERVVIETSPGELTAGWLRAGGEDFETPFLLSPRATKILNDQPLIQWHPLSWVDGYRVTVLGGGIEWTTIVVDGENAALTYPANAPPLQPGVAYHVVVVDLSDGRSSEEEDAPNMSFSLSPPQEVETIQVDAAAILDGVANEEAAALALARFYITYAAYADAVLVLTETFGEQSQDVPEQHSPVLYVLWADLYTRVGLESYAQLSYQNALRLAGQHYDADAPPCDWGGLAGDLASQAEALQGLARLATDVATRDHCAAQALAVWNALGAGEEAAGFQAEMATWTSDE